MGSVRSGGASASAQASSSRQLPVYPRQCPLAPQDAQRGHAPEPGHHLEADGLPGRDREGAQLDGDELPEPPHRGGEHGDVPLLPQAEGGVLGDGGKLHELHRAGGVRGSGGTRLELHGSSPRGLGPYARQAQSEWLRAAHPEPVEGRRPLYFLFTITLRFTAPIAIGAGARAAWRTGPPPACGTRPWERAPGGRRRGAPGGRTEPPRSGRGCRSRLRRSPRPCRCARGSWRRRR